ncbi:MAG: 5-amino-6-(D-ribitylamino)uracil--L-tyrosine 4-hydroxyphenyl transferase CofH [Candidatus Acidiferrales bacterium]
MAIVNSVTPARRESLNDALTGARPSIRGPLESALEGRKLDFDECLLLAQADGADLTALIRTADELRRRQVGDVITYVVNRNINFTNVCMVGCAFCGFGRGPNASDAYFLSIEQIVAKATDAWKAGATEVCIQGGLPKDFDGFFYRDILRGIRSALPEMHIHAFSPMEIAYGVEKTGMPLREYLLMLKEEGLNTIPGTAAEVLDDDVRAALSPNKLKVKQWVEIVRTAHSVGIRSTSTLMYGHVETPEHWVRHMMLLREIQEETGGFTEFVPLGFIHEKTRLYRKDGSRPGFNQRENLAVHALARVLFNGLIPNVQVSWVKMGFDESLACLEAGANDFSGTLMEEHISQSAGATHGEYVSPAEFRAYIRRIGRVPAERTTTYQLRRVFSADIPEADEENEALPARAARLRLVDQPAHYTGSGY